MRRQKQSKSRKGTREEVNVLPGHARDADLSGEEDQMALILIEKMNLIMMTASKLVSNKD